MRHNNSQMSHINRQMRHQMCRQLPLANIGNKAMPYLLTIL
jgi:hypothetical protein